MPPTNSRRRGMTGGPGEPLAPDVRVQLERGFGADLRHVRIHTDPSAAATAQQVGARAYTVGDDVHFARGQFTPETTAGRKLLAHEIAHVLQPASRSGDQLLRSPDESAATTAPSGEVRTTSPDAAAVCEAAPPAVAPAERFSDVNSAMNAAMAKVQEAEDLRTTVAEVVPDAFRAARDAVDPAAATELAAVAIRGLGEARQLLHLAGELADRYDPVAAVTSQPGRTPPAVPEPTALDYELHPVLVDEIDACWSRQREIELALITQLSPQEFRGTLAAGALAVPAHGDRLDAIVREASSTVDLLITVVAIEEKVVGGGRAEDLRDAVGLVELWRSRPINLYFLSLALPAVLGERWAAFAAATGPSGQSFTKLFGRAVAGARDFGALTDVGSYDRGRMSDLLTYGAFDWAVTDENALDAFEMIASASPDARLPILRRLHREGLLTRLCSNLPARHVAALLEAIGSAPTGDAAPVAAVLRKHLGDVPAGQTATELYEEQIMGHIEKGNYVRGYLWTLLNVSHSALTLGFKDIHDQAYVGRREGLISSDAYWSTTALAAGRTAALLALTAGTGAGVGGFAEGFALARGAGASTASLLGAAAGGGAAGLTGQFGADVYDQALMGREGFSSAGDYATAFGLGAGGGLLVAGVGAASARYLPGGARSAQRMFEYHSGSPAGRYSFAQGPRQGLHRGLYQMYRGASFAGRNTARASGMAADPYESFFEWVDARGRKHIFYGEDPGSGGHLWPANPEGGPTLADPTSRSGPKSSYPRTWNQERIMEVVAETVSSPTHPWYRSGQVGVGPVEQGLPFNWHNQNTRFATEITVEGVTVRIISRPTAGGVITAFPVGGGDPANLMMAVPPYAALTCGPDDG